MVENNYAYGEEKFDEEWKFSRRTDKH
jgi:hypothetical protein